MMIPWWIGLVILIGGFALGVVFSVVSDAKDTYEARTVINRKQLPSALNEDIEDVELACGHHVQLIHRRLQQIPCPVCRAGDPVGYRH